MPRLGHKKSRNGCRQCKARHVKCDESKPCSNCARHGVLCSLVDPNAPPTVASGGSSSSAPKRTTKAMVERPKKSTPDDEPQPDLPLEYVLNPSPAATAASGTSEGDSPHSGSDTFPFLTKFVNRRQHVEANLWLKDLALMHHWMAEACDTLSLREEVKHMWRIDAPKYANIHTFLMHEILAFSALHLAYLQPERHRDYYALGIHHQDHALRGMRKVLQNITEENASALFATSTVLTLSVFASRGQEAMNHGPTTQHVIDDLADIFALIQGMGIIISAQQMTIMSGPFAVSFGEPKHETDPQPIFPKLLARVPALLSFIENQEDLEEDMRREIVAAVALIRDNIIRSSKPCMDYRELRFLFYWPLHLSANFVVWLRKRHAAALVVLMHYAVVLYAAEPRFWFMNGWADRALQGIGDAIVDEDWRCAVQWPLHFIEAQNPTPPMDVPIGTAI